MLSEILILVGIPVARGLAGWAENAFADGKISKIEWTQLGATILRIGIPAALVSFGLGVDPTLAASGAALVDFAGTKVRSAFGTYE